jgi:superfamily II DNA or RNA helicase
VKDQEHRVDEKSTLCLQDIQNYIATLKYPFELHDYQIDTICECITNHRKLVLSPTSSGKSASMFALANYYKDFGKVLILFPTTALVMQTRVEFISYGADAGDVHEIFEDRSKDTNKSVVLATWQGLYTQPQSYFRQFNTVVVDECFTPDTEILTNKGFIRFDCLDKSELVAQFDADNNEISFIKPIRHIENDYNGKLINATSPKRMSLTTTPNHEMLLFGKNKHIKKIHKDVSYNDNWSIKTCGLTTSILKTELTEFDKLLIAYQADGYLYSSKNNGVLTLGFHFSKQRKIDKFLDIMSKGDFNFREAKGTESNGNTKESRRFVVYDIQYAYKDISKNFNLEELSIDVCKQIIEEMVCWDGSIIRDGLYSYSSTIKANVDFYQSIAVLCNYHTNQIIKINNRSVKFNDAYILFVSKNKNKIKGDGITKSEIDYVGKVYCVEVPTGNIIVRHNGKVVVTGNCHTAVAKSLTSILEKLDHCKYRFGFTGTLDGIKTNELQLIGLLGSCKQMTTTKQLIENKQISDVKIKMLVLKHPYKMFNTYSDEIKYLVDSDSRNKLIKKLVGKIKGNTLILFSRVAEHAMPIHKQLTEEYPDKDIYLVHGKIKTDIREEIRQVVETQDNAVICASYQTFQQGINIKNLHNIIFASPSKSRIRNLQSLGRGLRLHKSKKYAVLYDIGDNISNGNHKNYTFEHMLRRIQYYAAEDLNFETIELNIS